MKQDMIGNVPGKVLGMMTDLCHKLQYGKITTEELGLFLKRKNPFIPEDVDVLAIIAEWQEFYREFFKSDFDFSKIRIPERQLGFNRLIVNVKGMTSQRLYNKCKELFPCWKWTKKSLDEIVHSERNSENESYTVWFRDRVEADEELKNLSADKLKKQGILGITLEERLLYELKFFKETKKHLDVQNVTLCSGSCYSGGEVPNVGWFGDRFEVHWYNPWNSRSDLRARVAVF